MSETDSTKDYDSMLDNFPTDTDRVQQYRRDNAMTPSPLVPTITTTYGQGANATPAGMTTSASITTPSIPTAAVRISSNVTNAIQPTGISIQRGMTTGGNEVTQPPVPPTIGPPPAMSVSLPALQELSSPLNPNAQRFVPQANTQQESGLTANTPHVMAYLVEQLYLSRVPAPEPRFFSGNPLEYVAWKSAFEALIDQRRIPAREKMHYLKNA